MNIFKPALTTIHLTSSYSFFFWGGGVLLFIGRINKINRQGGPFLFLFLPKKFNGFFFFFFICCQFVIKKGIISWVAPPPLSSPGRTTRILQLSRPPFSNTWKISIDVLKSLCVCVDGIKWSLQLHTSVEATCCRRPRVINSNSRQT